MSRAMVCGGGNGVAGREEVTARNGRARGRGRQRTEQLLRRGRAGVKRNIFQQISHVCLIMHITACGAENQNTAAAVALPRCPPWTRRGSALLQRRARAAGRGGEWRKTRSPLYFILIINSWSAWPIAIRLTCRNAKFHGARNPRTLRRSPPFLSTCRATELHYHAPRNFLAALSRGRSTRARSKNRENCTIPTRWQLKRNYVVVH